MNEPTQSESSLSTGRDLVEEDSSRGRSIESRQTSGASSKRSSAPPRGSVSESVHSLGDLETARRILDGDDDAFGELVERYNSTMIRVARAHVPSRAVAEEVAQEAWLALLQGLSGFKGRSSLKTWLFGILLNRAKTRGKRERRSTALSSAHDSDVFSAPIGWTSWGLAQRRPQVENSALMGRIAVWTGSPEDRLLNAELRACLEKAVLRLTSAQRVVLILRDIEGWSSGEVCQLLEITPENQRVRLHRARIKIRDAVTLHLAEGA